MKFTIDGNEYEFDPDSLRNDEAMLIEKTCGVTFKQWGELLKDGSVTAMTALVWIVQRRQTPGLGFDDVRFEFSGLDVAEDSPTVPPQVA